MEVTNENFNQIYDEMAQKIKECDFCSIDCELSGITNYKNLNSFDTPKHRYDKMRKFGICLFKSKNSDAKSNVYETSAYNCFLFPRSQNCKYTNDISFSCLNSSIEFLVGQGFDFNKVFAKGISFMSKENEEKWRTRIQKQIDDKQTPKEIDEFFGDENVSKKEIKFSEFVTRVYVEKNLKQKYSNVLKYEYTFLENKERLMTLSKVDSKNQKSDLDILDDEVGFSKIIWLLSQSQKLIVGHNMLTDVMQILRHFFSQLPDNYDDFKSMTTSLFPNILDTKYMASLTPLKELINNTTLGDMDKILDKEPFPKLTLENCEYSTNNEKLHEAGYDAFLTEEPKRDNVFYLTFPPTWEAQNIYDLFSTFGAVFIGWIDDVSAFVALQNPENTKKAAAQLVGISGRDYKVYFYSTYVNQISKDKGDVKSAFNNKNNNIKPANGNKNTSSPQIEKRKVLDESKGDKKGVDDEETVTNNSETPSQQVNKSLKKIKLDGAKQESDESALIDKPFQECSDWSVNNNGVN